MAIDFPSSPTTGDQVTSGNIVWEYDGEKWVTLKSLFNQGILSSGTSTAPSIAFNGDPDTGIYSPGANQLAISTNGTGRLFVDSSGSVGVGTANPQANLEVFGTARIKADDGSHGFEFYPDVSGLGFQRFLSYNRTTSAYEDLSIGVNNFIVTAGSSTELFRCNANGNVGIGTSNPQADLTVSDSGAGGLEFNANWVGSGAGAIIAYNRDTESRTNLAITSQDTVFFGGGTERMRIKGDGNVGIGTSDPDSPLHVYLQASDRTARFQRISSQYIDVIQNSGINAIYGDGKDFAIGTTSANPLIFRVNDIERARITSDGNVGIGTANPNTKLDVSGDVTTSGDVTLNLQANLRFADSDSSNWVAFQAPATVGSNVTWTLPDADGTVDQVLSTDGSGNLAWQTPSAGVSLGLVVALS